MHKLDEIALNIELVLISIIEGVALYFLASSILDVLHGELSLTSMVFAFSGLFLLMVFWSQAILHAISFIRWPLQMERMLLYFVVVLLQVIAYSNLANSTNWFLVWSIFSVLALVIYAIDLRIIKEASPSFALRPSGESYVAEVLRRHNYEMKFLVPLLIAVNGIAFAGLYIFGAQYPGLALMFGVLQFLVSLGTLIDCLGNFKKRSALLPKLFS